VVAEQFGTLEALHPGRIDLGIGRAPGTDPLTAMALRRHGSLAADDFPEQLRELLGYFDGDLPAEHPFASITANPGLGHRPEVWLLGSSDFSAIAAGMLGLPFSFAHHFAAGNTDAAVAAYRANFRPSMALAQPHVMLGVSVICADDDDRAEWLAGPSRLSFLRLRSGRPGRFPTPEEAAERTLTPMEKELLRGWIAGSIVGGPETVERRLRALVERTGADELIVTTMVHGHFDRLASYRLLADLAGLGSEAAA
jgi:luciferase family oxidoreductase group 1